MLMDLSKAFDTINYELLVPKFIADGFSKEVLKFIFPNSIQYEDIETFCPIGHILIWGY